MDGFPVDSSEKINPRTIPSTETEQYVKINKNNKFATREMHTKTGGGVNGGALTLGAGGLWSSANVESPVNTQKKKKIKISAQRQEEGREA